MADIERKSSGEDDRGMQSLDSFETKEEVALIFSKLADRAAKARELKEKGEGEFAPESEEEKAKRLAWEEKHKDDEPPIDLTVITGDTELPGFETKHKVVELDTKADRHIPEYTINRLSNPGRYFVLDIETVAQKENEFIKGIVKPKKGLVKEDTIKKSIDEKMSKLALSPMTGEIILTGFYADKRELQIGLDGGTEKAILEETIAVLQDFHKKGYRMLTYFGKGFDLPYIMKRTIINGITEAIYDYNSYVRKYAIYPHLDICEFMGEGSLAEWNYLLGYGTSWESEGNLIGEWYEKDMFKEIKEKNLQDLKKVDRMYEKFIKGWTV